MRPVIIRLLSAVLAAAVVLPGTALAATATTTALTADRTTFQYSHEVTYAIAVDPVPDGGTAVLKIRDFEGDVVVYRSGALHPETGRVAFKVKMSTDLPPTEYTATATFLGTAAFDGSVSDPLTVKLNPNTTTTELDVRPTDGYQRLVPGGSAMLVAVVNRGADGFIRFSETTGAAPVVLRTVKVAKNCCGGSHARITISDVSEGQHTYLAEFLGSMTGRPSSASASADFAWGVDTRLSLEPAVVNPVQQHHNVVFPFKLSAPRVGVNPTGMVSLIDVETGAVADTAAAGDTAFRFLAPSLGGHTYRAVYGGDEHFAGATSRERRVRIIPDLVEVSVYRSGGTFWPSPRDGIVDEFTFAGWRYERARVKIRIFAPNGDLVEDHRIRLGRDEFEWSWDGRDSSGRVRSEGAYRAVQEVFDAFDTRLRIEGVILLAYGTPPAF